MGNHVFSRLRGELATNVEKNQVKERGRGRGRELVSLDPDPFFPELFFTKIVYSLYVYEINFSKIYKYNFIILILYLLTNLKFTIMI